MYGKLSDLIFLHIYNVQHVTVGIGNDAQLSHVLHFEATETEF